MMDKTKKKQSGVSTVVRGLKGEVNQLSKPTKNELIKGTLVTFAIAVVSAVTISAFDTCFSALVGLFL